MADEYGKSMWSDLKLAADDGTVCRIHFIHPLRLYENSVVSDVLGNPIKVSLDTMLFRVDEGYEIWICDSNIAAAEVPAVRNQ